MHVVFTCCISGGLLTLAALRAIVVIVAFENEVVVAVFVTDVIVRLVSIVHGSPTPPLALCPNLLVNCVCCLMTSCVFAAVVVAINVFLQCG